MYLLSPWNKDYKFLTLERMFVLSSFMKYCCAWEISLCKQKRIFDENYWFSLKTTEDALRYPKRCDTLRER